MRRKILTQAQRRLILEKQKGYCCYCGQFFGELAWYKKPVILRPEIEHMVPFSLSGNEEPSNFVAACQVCNIIKRNKYFKSMKELVAFIQAKWRTNGEMTTKRKCAVAEKSTRLTYNYGKNLGQYDDLTKSQIKFIKSVIKETKQQLAATQYTDNDTE